MSAKRRKNKQESTMRRGAAAVEAAFILPLLFLLSFGAVDIAQYINLAQLVSNASREAANLASHDGTETVKAVEIGVADFVSQNFPRLSSAELSDALQVDVFTENNQPIPEGTLSSVTAGETLIVRVQFDFSAIRWINGPGYWNNNVNESTTFCRRE